ncbi:MAG TPA: S8 family peptidase [Candidatus Kapabacteria bacterium]|nr:S8 family peptidase [Candidatus Kapabacteria bacterium]
MLRPGALDSAKLMATYGTWGEERTGKGKGGTPQGGYYPQGYPYGLRHALMTERFYLDSSSNVITDTLLVKSLTAAGGKYLTRLTTASPIDTLSVSRNGDTVPSNINEWMVLHTDSTTDDLTFTYDLMADFARDVQFATPNYHGGQLLSRTPREVVDTCEVGFVDMIHAPLAWGDEVGHDGIRIAVIDVAVDWRHPDLGGAMGSADHVIWGWDFTNNDSIIQWFPDATDTINHANSHGTQTAGIIAALTNRNAGSVAGLAGGWGTLGGDTDLGTGVSLVVCGIGRKDPFGANAGFNPSIAEFLAAVFETSAKSTDSAFGLGVHAINYAIQAEWGSDPAVQMALAFAHENGVCFIAAKNQQATGWANPDYPADWDEPWVIDVGGSWAPTYIPSQPSREPQSDYGVQLDLLAPDGDDEYGICRMPNLSWTTKAGDSLGHSSSFRYGGFSGNSAAAPNVTGSVALLFSRYYRLDHLHLKGIEPEDIQGALKAFAFRGDGDRLTLGIANQCIWIPQSGYGYLDIGATSVAIDSGYEFRHFNLTTYSDSTIAANPYILSDTARLGYDTLYMGSTPAPGWTPLPSNWFYAYIPYEISKYYTGYGDFTKYKQRDYLLSDSDEYYQGYYRVDTFTCVLDTIWDLNYPLFAWGRSGKQTEKSGWSLDQSNDQTGWSRVINGSGGDSLNEGIYQTDSLTFKVITAQYYLYKVRLHRDSTGTIVSDTTWIGEVPQYKDVGTNFTVFGRVKPQFRDTVHDTILSSVKGQPALPGSSLHIYLDPMQNELTAAYYTDAMLSDVHVEIYDAIGRLLARSHSAVAYTGWNSANLLLGNLPSGMYHCRVSGSGYSETKGFAIIR